VPLRYGLKFVTLLKTVLIYIYAVSGNVLLCSYDWKPLFLQFLFLCMFVKYLMEKHKNYSWAGCVYMSIWPTHYQEQFWTVTVLCKKKKKENRAEICTLLCICLNFVVQFQGYTVLLVGHVIFISHFMALTLKPSCKLFKHKRELRNQLVKQYNFLLCTFKLHHNLLSYLFLSTGFSFLFTYGNHFKICW
jgi:hypothetical protein